MKSCVAFLLIVMIAGTQAHLNELKELLPTSSEIVGDKTVTDVTWSYCQQDVPQFAIITNVSFTGNWVAGGQVSATFAGMYVYDAQINDIKFTIKYGSTTLVQDDIVDRFNVKANQPITNTETGTLPITPMDGKYTAIVRYIDIYGIVRGCWIASCTVTG